MKFCEKCDNFMIVKAKGKSKDKKNRKLFLVCPSCGYEEPFHREKDKDLYVISQKIHHGSQDKTAILLTDTDNHKISEEEREANEWLFEDSGS